MMKLYFKSILYITLCSILIQPTIAQDELNVYSARKEALIKPLLDKFAEANNVKVNLVTSKADALIQRLISEGKNSPADVFITVDAGRLHRAQQADLLEAITDEDVLGLEPSQYQDPNGYWLGLSLRVRAIVYDPEKVSESELSTYENLAEPVWKNRICIRSSNNIYNQSLLASMIAHNGIEATQEWSNKLVENFARKPQGGDRDQVKAVASGQCDIAVVNSYYFGNMMHGTEEEKAAASKLKIFWPNQDDRGAHVNISGVGIAKHAKNKSLALQLVKFLLTEESQDWYANVNSEYPVITKDTTSETLQNWGTFKADTLNMSKLGELNAQAVQVMDKAGWR